MKKARKASKPTRVYRASALVAEREKDDHARESSMAKNTYRTRHMVSGLERTQ